MSWDVYLEAVQKGFLIMPILERLDFTKRLCPLQRRRERTQRASPGSTSFSVEREPECRIILMRQYASSPRREKSRYRDKRRATTRN